MQWRVIKIKYTRQGYTEAIKDLKFQAEMLNDICTQCSLQVKDQKIQNCFASVQGKAEEYLALFDRIIDFLEGKTTDL
jgi:hypothetical protein